jgi:hypothetical protein
VANLKNLRRLMLENGLIRPRTDKADSLELIPSALHIDFQDIEVLVPPQEGGCSSCKTGCVGGCGTGCRIACQSGVY